MTVPTETVVDQLLHDPPDVHEFAGWSGRLAAPVCVWKVIVTEAASVRLLVLAETVNVDCKTPDESMLMLVGDTDPEIVGSPLGQPATGQNRTVEPPIFEFALPSPLLRTSVKITYCDPAPNAGAPLVPGSVSDQSAPLLDCNGNCLGNAATEPSGWVVNVLSVT